MTGPGGLALATILFVASHLLLSHPLRAPLVARLGEKAFLGLYSLVSFLFLGWMVLAWRTAGGRLPHWVAPEGWWPIASLLMLLACIFLAGSLIRNPALPHPGAAPTAIPPPRGLFVITRHPMNWSFILWALVHVSLLGTPRNLIVATGILVLAWAGSIGQDRKKERQIGAPWAEWERRTSFIPFAALLSGRARWSDLRPGWTAVIGGLVLWAVITWIHQPAYSPLGGLFR